MTNKHIGWIFASLAGCLVMTIMAAVVAVGAFGLFVWRLDSPRPSKHAETYIRRYVPTSATLLESKDDHGGFLGDGTLWRVYELRGPSKQAFETTISNDSDWKPLPLSDEITRLVSPFHNQMPLDLTTGHYFFHDFQPEWSPDSKDLSKPVYDRSSFNFILMIYDQATGKLYIDNEDTEAAASRHAREPLPAIEGVEGLANCKTPGLANRLELLLGCGVGPMFLSTSFFGLRYGASRAGPGKHQYFVKRTVANAINLSRK